MENKIDLAERTQEQALTNLLLRVPLFSRLQGRQLQFFVKTSTSRRLSSGQVLCRRGERLQGFYILIRGQVAATHERVVAAPDTIGEVPLLIGQPMDEEWVAVEDCALLEVSRRNFALLLTRNPALCQRLCRNLIGRLSTELQEGNERVGELETRRGLAEARMHEVEMELNDLRMLRSYR